MKRVLFLLPLLLVCLAVKAQLQFGYFSYERLLAEMPEYALARQDLSTLKTKYEAEAQRGEEEFQQKFVDFLQGQKDFPQVIMQKRQAELQSLMDNGVAFRLKSQDLLEKAEKEMMQEVRKRLDKAVAEVGAEYGYAYILNTDNNNCPYINPACGVDVTNLVRQKLGLPTDAPSAGQLPDAQQP